MSTHKSLDTFAHEAHMRRAFELAREAGARGDGPFGSVLVLDDQIILEDSNRIVTENDIRRHPELHLAHLAAQKYSPAERRRIVMYTSTEPCPMCAGGMRIAGLARVVYSVGGDVFAARKGVEPTVRSGEILKGITQVQGPLLEEEGLQIHDEFESP